MTAPWSRRLTTPRTGREDHATDFAKGLVRFEAVRATAVPASTSPASTSWSAPDPPCHDHSSLSSLSGLDGSGDLLAQTLTELSYFDAPWVVENVAGAKSSMPGALVLCGTEFGLGAIDRAGIYRHLSRHRLFLSNVLLMGAGGCHCSGRLIGGVYGNGGGGQQTRGYKFHVTESKAAMGMPWADRAGVSLAIPPAYTEFIGGQLMAQISEVAA